MRRFADSRLSPSLVISIVALFAALGGTAWALTTGEVKTRHIANGAVTQPKLHANAVGRDQIRLNEVQDRLTFGQIRADGSIRSGSRNVVEVRHPDTGVYCLELDGLSDAETESLVASPHASGLPAFAGTAAGVDDENAGCGDFPSVVIEDENGAPVDARFTFQIAGS